MKLPAFGDHPALRSIFNQMKPPVTDKCKLHNKSPSTAIEDSQAQTRDVN